MSTELSPIRTGDGCGPRLRGAPAFGFFPDLDFFALAAAAFTAARRFASYCFFFFFAMVRFRSRIL